MNEPTMKEVLKLVTFARDGNGNLEIIDVLSHVSGRVRGNVYGGVDGMVGTINGRRWQFVVETPKEKAIRLIREGRGDEAIKVLQESE